ncbi:HEAT repeat domain-containing protein [Devosia submarina]|uniref:HEAT repeat domain-containing protein n=1 Tax=Devosia submarina TaxID=1173082 RepID=UPI000D392965|nr:HEAT repeat domain-containing protein [Devosia submarina]
MPNITSLRAVLVLWLITAVPAAAEGSLSGLAERATDISVDTDQFLQDVNVEVLRLLQHNPTDADLAAIPRLIDAFHRSGADRQANILKVLAHLLAGSKNHRSAIVDTAVQALQSPWHGVRVAALDVLGRSEDATAVPKLMASLSDPDWEVRYQALYGLSSFVDRAAHQDIFEAVAPLVGDENKRVREMARTLMRLAKEAGRQDL